MMRPSLWPRVRWLLVGLVVCRGIVDLCVLPPFEAWDEYQHVGYVEHVRQTGRAAVLSETNVSSALLEEVVRFPQPAVAVRDQLGRLGGVDYAAFWLAHNPFEPNESRPVFRGGSHPLYQAQHSPLAYRLAAPVYAALGGAKNLRASVGGLRLINVGLTAAAVWIVLGTLRRIFRRERDAALAGLALAAHPLFLLNGARVANDALGVLLASATVAAALAMMLTSGAGRRLGLKCLGIGLLVGLATTAKATNIGLVPFGAFAWLAAVVRGKVPAGRAVLVGGLMAAACLAIVQSELRFNLAHYDSFTSMQEAVINRRNGVTGADLLRSAATFDWPRSVCLLWGRELFFSGGWSFLRTHPTAVQMYRDTVTLGLLGWACIVARGLVRRLRKQEPSLIFTSGWVPASCLVLVASYTAALAFHMVQSKLTWGVSTTNPWYACPALPWFLVLVVAGGVSWPLGRWLRPAVPLVLAGAGLAAEIIAMCGPMSLTYSGGASGLEALRRLAWLQPGFLGTATLAAAAVGEIVVVAMLILTWRDDVRAEGDPAGCPPLLRGTHSRLADALSTGKTGESLTGMTS
jgi:hypothetical protein